MKVRVVVAVLLALVVGAGAGYAVSAADDDGAQSAGPAKASVRPVPASPTVPVAIVQPDPDDPPLAPDIDLVPETPFTAESLDGTTTYTLKIPVPSGWDQAFNGVATWGFTVPGNSENSYKLRVEIFDVQSDSIATALRRRTAEFGSAEAQGNMSDVEIDVEPTGDGFESSIIDVGGYRRIGIERFFPGPDGEHAFATVAVTGRVEDREGLKDLIDRISRDYRTSESPAP